MYHEPANALDTMGVVNDECHSASVDKAVGDRAIGDTASSAKIWIRYDAASPMAADSGRITVGDRVTGQQWTVALDGRGSLAPQYSAR